jgi:hypothetical protein
MRYPLTNNSRPRPRLRVPVGLEELFGELEMSSYFGRSPDRVLAANSAEHAITNALDLHDPVLGEHPLSRLK